MSKKILVVLTSVEKYPNLNRATGLWLGEAVHFVKKVEAAGYEVDYISPEGGYTPIDPHSLAMADETDWEWYQTKEFMNRLGTTLKPSEINPEDICCDLLHWWTWSDMGFSRERGSPDHQPQDL